MFSLSFGQFCNICKKKKIGLGQCLDRIIFGTYCKTNIVPRETLEWSLRLFFTLLIAFVSSYSIVEYCLINIMGCTLTRLEAEIPEQLNQMFMFTLIVMKV